MNETMKKLFEYHDLVKPYELSIDVKRLHFGMYDEIILRLRTDIYMQTYQIMNRIERIVDSDDCDVIMETLKIMKLKMDSALDVKGENT